jgi:hypothetical protein
MLNAYRLMIQDVTGAEVMTSYTRWLEFVQVKADGWYRALSQAVERRQIFPHERSNLHFLELLGCLSKPIRSADSRREMGEISGGL